MKTGKSTCVGKVQGLLEDGAGWGLGLYERAKGLDLSSNMEKQSDQSWVPSSSFLERTVRYSTIHFLILPYQLH